MIQCGRYREIDTERKIQSRMIHRDSIEGRRIQLNMVQNRMIHQKNKKESEQNINTIGQIQGR